MVGIRLSNSFTIQASRSKYTVNFSNDFTTPLKYTLSPGDIILIDSNILNIYKYQLNSLIEDNEYISIEPDETLKSYRGVEPIIDRLIKLGFKKNHRLIAIGGGITQDITAFISSILYRGINWIFFPTTLLAQCDSCIGSKTSINFGSFKNQIGGFYPPHEIFIDTAFIDSLSFIDKLSGLGEMAHYFLIAGRQEFELLENNFSLIFTDPNVLGKLIMKSLMIKKDMIEKDEFDIGPRNIFNYGHTFGHALESITDYAIPHGIAVSYGMDIANFISYKKKFIPKELMEKIRTVLSKMWHEIEFPEIDLNTYKSILMKDKKVVGNQLNCILTRGLADMFKTPLTLDDETMEWIGDCMKHYQTI
jgi:3-dehydroquinate synthase